MAKHSAHIAEDGLVEETLIRRGTTQPQPAVSAYVAQRASDIKTKARTRPRYQPTGIKLADRALDVVDTVTNGRADWVQRFVSYSVIGGVAALINLLTLALVLNDVPISGVSRAVRYAIAFALATEVSLMANFIPNDRITFSHLPGHSRSWLARCVRFHMTGIGGIIVTGLVSGSLHLVAHMPALVAQAVALIVALAFNFTFHHVFTYHHAPDLVQSFPAASWYHDA
jgi:putative flippase GtrA